MSLRAAVVATAAVLLAAPACAQGGTGGEYRVLSRTVLGGEGGWDYLTVDAAAHRLYISRSTHMMVVDLDSMKVVGDIAPTPGVHGIALALDLGRGFTSNGRDSTVSMVDLRTLATTRTVKVTGRNPDSITYDSVSHRVFTFNGGSGNSTVIDARTGDVVGTVTLGGRPEFAVADGRGTLFVNLEDKSQIQAIDTRTLATRGPWDLTGCEEPSGLAIDRVHRRLFSVCGNRTMAITDADNGHVVATVPIGEGPDGAGFDPGTQNAFSSNGEGTMTVVHEDAPGRFHVAQTVTTQRGARTMVVDPRTHRVYTVTAEFGTPPAPTPDRPRPRPPMVPNTFVVLTIGR